MRTIALMRFLFLGIALGSFVFSDAAAQQSQQPQPAPSIPCDAFQKEPNGLWSPTRQVTISSPDGSMKISIGPGASFGPGVRFAGLDLYTMLEQNCH